MYYICEWRCHGKSGVDGGVYNPTDHQRSHLHYATHQQKQCDMSGPTLEYSCTLDASVAWHTSRGNMPRSSRLSCLSHKQDFEEACAVKQKRGSEREKEKPTSICNSSKTPSTKSRCNLTKLVGGLCATRTDRRNSWLVNNCKCCVTHDSDQKAFSRRSHESRWVPNDWIYCFKTTVLESTDRYGSETQTHQQS